MLKLLWVPGSNRSGVGLMYVCLSSTVGFGEEMIGTTGDGEGKGERIRGYVVRVENT